MILCICMERAQRACYTCPQMQGSPPGPRCDGCTFLCAAPLYLRARELVPKHHNSTMDPLRYAMMEDADENDSSDDDRVREEDEEGAGEGREAPVPRRERLERIALFDFLRLVAGNRAENPFGTNEALVQHLKENGTLTR